MSGVPSFIPPSDPSPVPWPRPRRHRLLASVPAPHHTPLNVRAATIADVQVTARLHVAHLRNGLFPMLGARFVARWHRAHVESPQGIALVSYDRASTGQPVTGFLIGSVDRAAFRTELLTLHRRELALRGAGALLGRPHVLGRFLRTRSRAYLRRLRQPASTPAPRIAPPVAELTAIAVDPAARRNGTGRALTDHFLELCVTQGAARAELIAEMCASGFYVRTGWRPGPVHTTRDGRRVRRFSLDLHRQGPE